MRPREAECNKAYYQHRQMQQTVRDVDIEDLPPIDPVQDKIFEYHANYVTHKVLHPKKGSKIPLPTS